MEWTAIRCHLLSLEQGKKYGAPSKIQTHYSVIDL